MKNPRKILPLKIERLRDIPRMSQANYQVDVSWTSVERHLAMFADGNVPLVLDPPYQRGFVWTLEQQIAYLEFQIKGGMGGKDIFWNAPGWHHGEEGDIELVDGKQRLNAVQGFIANKIPVFGRLLSEFKDQPDPIRHRFKFHVNDLTDPVEVVQWYLDMNTGGSIHTEKDLQPAYAHLAKLLKKRGKNVPAS